MKLGPIDKESCHISIVIFQKTKSSHISNYFYKNHHRDVKGVQIFEGRTDNKVTPQELADPDHRVDSLGLPVPHISAQQHTTGEAVYVDDIPKRHGINKHPQSKTLPIVLYDMWTINRIGFGVCLLITPSYYSINLFQMSCTYHSC